MRKYYYQRHWRDGQSRGGYCHGAPNRCETIEEAVSSAIEFADQIKCGKIEFVEEAEI